MKQILFLTNYASPYRVKFFDELGKYAQVTVLFSEPVSQIHHRNAGWFEPGTGGFQQVQLKKLCRIQGGNLCPEVIRWLKRPYDEIIICGYSSPTAMLAMAYLKGRKIPFRMEVDGGLIRQESRKKYAFKRRLVTLADSWLSTGEHTSRYLVHYGAQQDRIQVYPFASLYERDLRNAPVPPEEKQRLRRELDMKEEQVVLAIGQFIHRKGFDVLIQAAAHLPKTVGFYLVGAQAPEEYLRLRRELELDNLHFLGFRKKEELARIYQAADLFVLPTREDIWGLVINEAMAYGLPVVTTNRCVAGLELVQEGKTGCLVDPEDPEALADRIRRILAADRQAMGQAALEAIRPYTLENMAKVHMEIFNHRR